MNLENMLIERSQSQETPYCMILLYEKSRISKSIEKVRFLRRGWVERHSGVTASDYGVSFGG